MDKTMTRGDQLVGYVKLYIDLMKLDSFMKRHGSSHLLITPVQKDVMVQYYTLVAANNRLKARQHRLELFMLTSVNDDVIDTARRHISILQARRCVLNELIVLIKQTSMGGERSSLLMDMYSLENAEVGNSLLRHS